MTDQRGPRAKNWTFTLNNYTDEDVARLSLPLPGTVAYLIFGKEVGESGTPHLQGYVSFKNRVRMQHVLAFTGQAHLEIARFPQRAIEYCKKEGDFYEFGVAPAVTQGKRTDMEAFKDSVKSGIYDFAELRELHSEICAQYPRFVKEYVDDNKPKYRVPCHPLRPWQANLHARLALTPNDREIIFIVDVTGNHGKSWFARYYCNHHEKAQIVVPGKKADMAYAINDDMRVFFFDCPRSKQGDFIQYDLLEELKNGLFFKNKYESRMIELAPPHVVVLMNESPDPTKLSADRYTIIRLD